MLNQSSARADVSWSDTAARPHRFGRRLWCALFGHRVSNAVFATVRGPAKHCPCGERILDPHAETRVSHTVSCFLFAHRYIRIAVRDGHHEYVCTQCGHPLLFRMDRDPYADQSTFLKKVRYLCNLFGHSVHPVAARHGFHEYACDCGHSFLKEDSGRTVVKHPVVCLLAGHYLRFTERRGDYEEYLCRNCGHTFSFVVTE